MSNRAKENQTVDELVESLFTTGSNERASRLLLVKEDYTGSAQIAKAQNLGGWGREAIRNRISDFLKAAPATTKTITREEYLELLGLFVLVRRNLKDLDMLGKAVERIVGEENGYKEGWVGDEFYSDANADSLLQKLKITVEEIHHADTELHDGDRTEKDSAGNSGSAVDEGSETSRRRLRPTRKPDRG